MKDVKSQPEPVAFSPDFVGMKAAQEQRKEAHAANVAAVLKESKKAMRQRNK
jgi:hypothetical protein